MVFTSIVWIAYVLSLIAGYFGLRWLWHSARYLMEPNKDVANRHRAIGKRMGLIHGRLSESSCWYCSDSPLPATGCRGRSEQLGTDAREAGRSEGLKVSTCPLSPYSTIHPGSRDAVDR